MLDKSRNIFPFPFSLFINDIEQYLEDNGVESLDMINEVSFEVLDIYQKIFLLLYAEVAQNTRVMSDNKELDICESYNYFGILFNFNNNFLNAKKKLVEQA